MKILLDMDGVLVDFVGGICRAHRRSNPFDDSANHGCYDIDKLWGVEPAEFWAPADEEFWAGLEPTPDSAEIIRLVTDYVGIENVCLLSSPCAHPGCPAGKLRWIERHLPEFKRRFLLGPRKEFCAAPNRILVDDWDQNVSTFRAAGGLAVLVPRPWNSLAGGAPLISIGANLDFLLNEAA